MYFYIYSGNSGSFTLHSQKLLHKKGETHGQLLWPSHCCILFASWCQEWQSSINSGSHGSLRAKFFSIIGLRNAFRAQLISISSLSDFLLLQDLLKRFVHNAGVLALLGKLKCNTPSDYRAGRLAAAKEYQNALLLPHPHSPKTVSEAIGRRLIYYSPAVFPLAFSPATNDFRCFSHVLAYTCACISSQTYAALPRQPGHLSLLSKA